MRWPILTVVCAHTLAWNIDQGSPSMYTHTQIVDLKVNGISSSITKLSYPYYTLPVCRPESIHTATANLGQLLTGDLIQNSPYDIRMQSTATCQTVCSKHLSADDVDLLVHRIDDGYALNWLVDNLPPGVRGLPNTIFPNYNIGIPLGTIDQENGDYIIYNHHRVILKYNQLGPSRYDLNEHQHASGFFGPSAHIVGFEVQPVSVDHRSDGVAASCAEETGMPIAALPLMVIKRASTPNEPPPIIQYSYDVFWEKSEIQWANRWDVYLANDGNQKADVHWFSIINSVVACMFLTMMVYMALVRAFRDDVTTYSRVVTQDEVVTQREEPGWKLVHGDVFRPPARFSTLLAVATGVGAQLVGTAGMTIVLATLGQISQVQRGSIVLGIIATFLLSAPIGGFAAGRVHKFFDGTSWVHVAMLTGIVFPACVLTVLFTINVLFWVVKSSNAAGWSPMLALVALWLIISVPLVFLGTLCGFKMEKVSIPLRVESTPRPIPTQKWHMHTPVVMLFGGALPFGAIFVEMFCILTSLWQHWYYSVFGFLLIVFVLLLITAAELSICSAYLQLSAEDYHWWWRSMLVPAFSGVYFFMYSMLYYYTRLQLRFVGWVPPLMYFGYMGIVAIVISLITGATGFLATFYFLRTLYKAKRTEILIA